MNAYTVNDMGGVLQGQLFVDPSINYALLTMYSSANGNAGYVGILQKGALTSTTYQETDLIGDWLGTAIRVNANLEVTETSESSIIITNPEGIMLSGMDGDGSFSAGVPSTPNVPSVPGILLDLDVYRQSENFGIYVSGDNGVTPVNWPATEASYSAIYAMSTDKKVMAAGFIAGTCNYSLFSDLPNQKFAIWTKQ